jgi:N utilization substance protein B
MSTSHRTRARELVLQALYALETGNGTSSQVAEDILQQSDLDASTLEFALGLFEKTRQNGEEADSVIADLAANWKLERIAVVDRIILRMAMTELKEMVDVPVKVVLNEAIELAKLYSTANSSAFINGILDSFVKNSSKRFEV